MSKVYVNGELVEHDQALLSVFDHGLVVGDGVFETILLHEDHPFALTRHLDRLERSLKGLGIAGVQRAEVDEAIRAVVATTDYPRGRIRVTITSGIGPLGSARGTTRPSVVVACEPAVLNNDPCAVFVVPWTRNEHGPLVGLKTTSYAENARALALAHDNGADEAIFANTAGNLCEGTGSNVFVVLDGELITTPLSSGCLAGTTRDLLVEYGQSRQIDLEMKAFSPRVISEAFLASSVRGVQAISAIGEEHFEEAPGPFTKVAQGLFAKLLDTTIDP